MFFAIKYREKAPIYITSKQDNNLLLADRKLDGAYGRAADYQYNETRVCSREAAVNSRRKKLWQ
ncbi:hypothetical protein D7Y06_25530 [Roseburia sp. 1XD42-69]|nr:hypothetical protein D7Y06_25530 [Roseburia sp. 1XD42-69]